ncbi:embryonic polarity protein dorsal-like isoform X2 [Lineus longissimus]|uniref:embryonic polarity protein dorsal-like isoform X2 n=1 Tax=Lineus longissimus TaxID=88925 RepID=UPI002B4EA865
MSGKQGMSAASIAAGSGRGRRSNGKMNSQAPVLNNDPWVKITEEPKSRGLRFRYECEGRSAGSIPGERSQIERKSFPAIKIHNYQGTAVVVVSCVTKDNPPKSHPHSLVGKGCDKGVYTQKIKSHDMVATFPHLGIQCAKRKDVDDALKQRETIRVDPFSTGFKHKANQIDLNVVRLCFQVFLPDSNGRFTRIVAPVVSNPIYDKKAAGDLVICRLDKHAGSVRGGEEVFLLCEKVNKDDIKVKFFEENDDGSPLWEAYGEFGASDVHRQFAIVFKTPPYFKRDINKPANVWLQLIRPSDEETSEPKQFIYKPEDHDPEYILAKKKRKVASMNPLSYDPASIPSTVPLGDPLAGDAEMMDISNSTVKERVKLKASRNIQTKEDSAQSTSAAGMDQYPLYDMSGTTDAALMQQMGYSQGYQMQAQPGGGDMYYSLPAGEVQSVSTEGMTHQQILESLAQGGVEQVNSSDSAELRRFVQENFPNMQAVDTEGNISLPGSLLASMEPLDVAANVDVSGGGEAGPQFHNLQTVTSGQQQS